MPFSVMALSLRFLPEQVPLLTNFGGDLPYLHKNRNLVIGIFCLIPIAAVIIAGELKRRKLIERNYYAVTVGATVISVAYLGFVIHQLVMQTSRVEVIADFDVVGVVSVGISFFLVFLGVPLYDLPPNAVIGFRNSYTMRSDEVWGRVHRNASTVCIIGFTLLGMTLSFVRGLPALLILLAAMVVYLLYTLVLSNYYFKKVVVQK